MKEFLKNKDELIEFLKINPKPKLVIREGIREGYVSCIGAVPRLFGAELHTTRETYKYLKEFL